MTETLDAPGGSAAPRGRWFACVLLACASFAAVAWTIGELVPWTVFLPDKMHEKVEWFRAHEDEFDVLVFGSSHVYRGLDPERMEARLAEKGVSTRSFNFAIPGAFDFECDEWMRRILAEHRGKARIVVIEVPEWKAKLANTNSERFVAWHTTRQTANVVRSTFLRDRSLGRTAGTMLPHLRAWVLNLANIGSGLHVTRAAFGLEERAASQRDVGRGHGFMPLDEVPEATEGAERHAQFEASLDEYRRELAALAASETTTPSLDTYDLTALRNQVAFVRERGFTLVYLVMPQIDSMRRAVRLAEQGELPLLLGFASPSRYPELYAVENRWDAPHLNARGAELFSRLFADEFLAVVKAAGEAGGRER